MSQGKTTDVFETDLQQGDVIHLSLSCGGYLHNIASWLKSRLPKEFFGSLILSHVHMTKSVLLQMFFLDLDLIFFKESFFLQQMNTGTASGFDLLVQWPLP